MDEEYSVEHYIEIGAVDVVGIDDDGEFMLKVNPIAQTIAPELWKVHLEYVDEMLLDLFEKGLLNVTYNEDLEASFELSDAGRQVLKDAGLEPLN